jgi:hypothetical protein
VQFLMLLLYLQMTLVAVVYPAVLELYCPVGPPLVPRLYCQAVMVTQYEERALRRLRRGD